MTPSESGATLRLNLVVVCESTTASSSHMTGGWGFRTSKTPLVEAAHARAAHKGRRPWPNSAVKARATPNSRRQSVATNPVRTCIGCGQTDDHPRHVIAIGADHSEVNWHMDCHARSADCEVCASQIQGADGAIGDELRTHLVTKDGE